MIYYIYIFHFIDSDNCRKNINMLKKYIYIFYFIPQYFFRQILNYYRNIMIANQYAQTGILYRTCPWKNVWINRKLHQTHLISNVLTAVQQSRYCCINRPIRTEQKFTRRVWHGRSQRSVRVGWNRLKFCIKLSIYYKRTVTIIFIWKRLLCSNASDVSSVKSESLIASNSSSADFRISVNLCRSVMPQEQRAAICIESAATCWAPFVFTPTFCQIVFSSTHDEIMDCSIKDCPSPRELTRLNRSTYTHTQHTFKPFSNLSKSLSLHTLIIQFKIAKVLQHGDGQGFHFWDYFFVFDRVNDSMVEIEGDHPSILCVKPF